MFGSAELRWWQEPSDGRHCLIEMRPAAIDGKRAVRRKEAGGPDLGEPFDAAAGFGDGAIPDILEQNAATGEDGIPREEID